MSSGVGVNPDCIKAFTDIKLGHKYRYVIYAISADLKEICVKSAAPPTASYDEFVQELLEAASEKQCRYGVYDAEYTLGSGQQRSKLVFVVWNPDTSPIKQKMIYSSSKDALKKAINFVAKDFQANDQEDLAWSNLLESVMRHEVAD